MRLRSLDPLDCCACMYDYEVAGPYAVYTTGASTALQYFCCLFCCFTSQVNSYGHGGRVSSSNHTFSGQAWTSSWPVLHTFACYWQQPFLNDSAEGRRMTVEIISWSVSTKVWDRARIELATPGSAVRLASVARHVTNCTTRPGSFTICQLSLIWYWNRL